MASVSFESVTAAIDGEIVLRDVALDVADGEFIGIVGPSGSGKSTLLRTVAGFTDLVTGSVLLDHADVGRVPTGRRDVAMVVQGPALFPSKSVERNVSFPLEIRQEAPDEIGRRVEAEVRAMRVDHLLDRRPDTLTPGEAQLVQIARALVRVPQVLLLDEPFASLDAAQRSRLRTELSLLQEGYGTTTLMTTNDPDDAMSMPHRLVVMDNGRLVQVGNPTEVRRTPTTMFAAAATGECRFIQGRVVAEGDAVFVTTAPKPGHTTESGARLRHRVWHAALLDRVGTDVVIGLRSDDVLVTPNGPVASTIVQTRPGRPGEVECDVGGTRIPARLEQGSTTRPSVGDDVRLRIDHFVTFDSTTGRLIA